MFESGEGVLGCDARPTAVSEADDEAIEGRVEIRVNRAMHGPSFARR